MFFETIGIILAGLTVFFETMGFLTLSIILAGLTVTYSVVATFLLSKYNFYYTLRYKIIVLMAGICICLLWWLLLTHSPFVIVVSPSSS